jgi:site-specific DNA-methyltransferase (adenine-specific)
MSGTSTGATSTGNVSTEGRFPANLILDEMAAEMLDAQSGISQSRPDNGKETRPDGNAYGHSLTRTPNSLNDSGGASRFFYVAKASKRERNEGLEASPEVVVDDGRNTPIDNPFLRGKTERKNTHPTVKPVKLMEYLVKLVTPPKGTVLDPFMGSGSTGVACKNLGFGFIGIEKEAEYLEIAKKRTA